MRTLKITNALGQSVTLGVPPYSIATLDGIDFAPIDEQEQKAPYQDGTTHLDSLFEARTITVTGAIVDIHALGAIFTARQALLAILNPKNGPLQIAYTNDNAAYVTTGSVTAPPVFPNKLAIDPTQQYQLQFYCNDPYLYAAAGSSSLLTLVTGGLTFPITFPVTFGTYTGSVPTAANNIGDSVTPVLITITGPSLNPIITNQATGEVLAFNISLNLGDSLVVNTKFGSKSAVYYPSSGGAQNVMGNLLAGSSFWSLDVGSNLILFSDATNGSATCTVAWSNRYSGT